MAVPPIFKDTEKQILFEKQGFVILPFLNLEQLEQLRRLYEELHPQSPKGGFIAGSASSDFAYKKNASDSLVRLFTDSFEQYFQNYQPFGASFLFKNATENSEVGIHQDWTIVDEEQFVALNIWVPLDNINKSNGPLMVLPGSQYSKHSVHRAPTLPFFFQFREAQMIKKLIPQYVSAGEAVVLNQSLIHYSPANTSGVLRRAVTAGIKTKGAPMKFYYKKEADQSDVEVFEMEEDFLIQFENFEKDIFLRPKHGRCEKITRYDVPKYSDEELNELTDKLLESAGFTNKNWWQKMIEKFSNN